MAETPKGDTASPTDAAPDAAPDAVGDETVRPRRTAGSGGGGAPDNMIAGDVGQDRLASAGDAESGPWSPSETDRVEPVAAPGAENSRPGAGEPVPASRPGGLRRALILVILLALVIGGGYATYPVWRGEVETLARQFGIALPGVETAPAPQPSEPVNASQPEAPQSEAPSAAAPGDGTPTAPGGGEAASSERAPVPPATVADPALAGDVERLQDRINAIEQRLSAIENRAPEAPKAETATVEQLAERVDGMAQSLTAVTDEVAIIREGLAVSGGGEGLGPLAAQLSDRLQGLTDRMDTLERSAQTAPAEPAVTAERVDALQARVETVAGDLDTEVRKSAEDVVKLETRLSEMQARLVQIAKALETTRSGRERAGAFLLAANQLAAAAGTSGGFEAELQALRAAAPAGGAATTALEALGRHVGGVPSLAVLRNRFGATAAAAVDASVIGSGEGVVGQILTRVASLITIRRTETTDSDGLDAVLVRAETTLAAGDLAGAIQAMKKLDGAPASAAAAWLADAEARAAVDGAVRALQAAALAGVAGG